MSGWGLHGSTEKWRQTSGTLPFAALPVAVECRVACVAAYCGRSSPARFCFVVCIFPAWMEQAVLLVATVPPRCVAFPSRQQAGTSWGV